MKERLTLSVREQKRLLVMNEVEKRKMKVREAVRWRSVLSLKGQAAASNKDVVSGHL